MSELPLRLRQATGVPYYRQVVDGIGDLVRGGHLLPGARLPSVRVLAAQLEVSLITVRRAYADLETAGLLVRRQGQGTFVTDTVGDAARQRAHADASDGLVHAVERARSLGLPDPEIRSVVDRTLAAPSSTPPPSTPPSSTPSSSTPGGHHA